LTAKVYAKPVFKIFAFTVCGYALFLLSANICQATFSVRKGLYLKSFRDWKIRDLGLKWIKELWSLFSCRALPFCCLPEPVEGSQSYSAVTILNVLQ